MRLVCNVKFHALLQFICLSEHAIHPVRWDWTYSPGTRRAARVRAPGFHTRTVTVYNLRAVSSLFSDSEQ